MEYQQMNLNGDLCLIIPVRFVIPGAQFLVTAGGTILLMRVTGAKIVADEPEAPCEK